MWKWGGVLLALALAAPAAALEPSRNLDDYALLGIQRCKLKNLSLVASGDVGTNVAATGGLGSFGLSLGRGVVLAIGTTAVGDKLKATGATVFDVFTNNLLSPAANVTINGTGPAPFTLPLISPLPSLPAFAPGATNVTVPVGGSLALPPGAYANLVAQNGSELVLSAGTYEFQRFQTGKLVKVLILGPVTINVAMTFRLADNSFFGPDAAGFGAADIRVNVGGTLARFGSGSHATLYLYAPNGKVLFGRGFVGIGQFVGKNINTDHSVQISHPVCGDGTVDPGEECDPPDGQTCDATCHFPVSTTTTTSTTTTSTTGTTTTSTTTSSTDPTVPPTTTTTTMPVAICGNGVREDPEECDPPFSACGTPPDGECQLDCTCFFAMS